MADGLGHQDFVHLSIPWEGEDGHKHVEPCYISFGPSFEPSAEPHAEHLLLEIVNTELGRRLESVTFAAPGPVPAPGISPVRVGWQPLRHRKTLLLAITSVVLAAVAAVLAAKLGPPFVLLPVLQERLAADLTIENAVTRYGKAVFEIRAAPTPRFDRMSTDVSEICAKLGSPSVVFFGRDTGADETGIEIFDGPLATLGGASHQLAASCEHLLLLLSRAAHEHDTISRQLGADGDVVRTAVRGLRGLEADLTDIHWVGQSLGHIAGAISYNLSPSSDSQWPWAVASTRNTTDRLRRISAEALEEVHGRFGRLVDGAIVSVEKAQATLGGCEHLGWLSSLCSPTCCRMRVQQASKLQRLRDDLALRIFTVREGVVHVAGVIVAADEALSHLDGATEEMGALAQALDSLQESGWVVKTSSGLTAWDLSPATALLESLRRAIAALL